MKDPTTTDVPETEHEATARSGAEREAAAPSRSADRAEAGSADPEPRSGAAPGEPAPADAERLPGRLSELVTLQYPRSALAEAYRDLRTSLNFARLDNPLRSIVITSSGPAEGKSTTAANLGVTMAQAGSSVIVIDADLRRASLDKYFGMSNQFGLTNALFDQKNLSLYVRTSPLERLHVLTSGPLPPNPSELLGSQRMRGLVAQLRSQYDCVLIDSPPVGSVSDALVLSPMVDGVVLVVHAGGLPREVVQRAKGKLDQAQARLLGVVLNKVDIEREQPYYYYYSYSSPYYGHPAASPGE